jgi:hypothetical protein
LNASPYFCLFFFSLVPLTFFRQVR